MKIMTALVLAFLVSIIPAAQLCHALEKPGMMLPDITLPDAGGQEHNLGELLKDKVAVIVYWSISCPHCRREMPALMELNQNLTGNPFRMIMVNSDSPAMASAAAKFAEQNKLPGPILIDAGPKDSMPLGEAFDIIVTPTVMVLDTKGKFVHAQETKVDMDKLLKAIEAAF